MGTELQPLEDFSDGERTRLVVSFHQVDAPGRHPGCRWIAELVDAEGDWICPFGVAWVFDSGGLSQEPFRCLEYILVPDEYRRRGFGKYLVKACQARWPGLDLLGSESEAGEALLDSVTRE
jgi:hypothetical protein